MEQILDDIIGAIVGYPPKPITTSGFLNKIINNDLITEIEICNKDIIFCIIFLLLGLDTL